VSSAGRRAALAGLLTDTGSCRWGRWWPAFLPRAHRPRPHAPPLPPPDAPRGRERVAVAAGHARQRKELQDIATAMAAGFAEAEGEARQEYESAR
jgi:hypothetical protein